MPNINLESVKQSLASGLTPVEVFEMIVKILRMKDTPADEIAIQTAAAKACIQLAWPEVRHISLAKKAGRL